MQFLYFNLSQKNAESQGTVDTLTASSPNNYYKPQMPHLKIVFK